MEAIKIFFIAIVGIGLCCCVNSEANEEGNPTENELADVWFSHIDSTYFTIGENHSYDIKVYKHSEPIVFGTLKIKGGQAIFKNDGESYICEDVEGIHSYSLVGDTLVFEKITDDCFERNVHLNKRFVRIANK